MCPSPDFLKVEKNYRPRSRKYRAGINRDYLQPDNLVCRSQRKKVVEVGQGCPSGRTKTSYIPSGGGGGGGGVDLSFGMKVNNPIKGSLRGRWCADFDGEAKVSADIEKSRQKGR